MLAPAYPTCAHPPRLSWQTFGMERLRPDDPEQIGPWQIVNRLGSGGMGVVYMGTNGTRAAAVKVVRDFLLEESGSRARLAREVETLQKGSNPIAPPVQNEGKKELKSLPEAKLQEPEPVAKKEPPQAQQAPLSSTQFDTLIQFASVELHGSVKK